MFELRFFSQLKAEDTRREFLLSLASGPRSGVGSRCGRGRGKGRDAEEAVGRRWGGGGEGPGFFMRVERGPRAQRRIVALKEAALACPVIKQLITRGPRASMAYCEPTSRRFPRVGLFGADRVNQLMRAFHGRCHGDRGLSECFPFALFSLSLSYCPPPARSIPAYRQRTSNAYQQRTSNVPAT
jgi:hypothetical protein